MDIQASTHNFVYGELNEGKVVKYIGVSSLKWCVLIFSICLVSSCSSLSLQLSDSERVCKEPTGYVYGGTVRNVVLAFGGLAATVKQADGLGALIAGYAVIDFPFSLVVDTLFLPLSVPRTVMSCHANEPPAKAGFLF